MVQELITFSNTGSGIRRRMLLNQSVKTSMKKKMMMTTLSIAVKEVITRKREA